MAAALLREAPLPRFVLLSSLFALMTSCLGSATSSNTVVADSTVLGTMVRWVRMDAHEDSSLMLLQRLVAEKSAIQSWQQEMNALVKKDDTGRVELEMLHITSLGEGGLQHRMDIQQLSAPGMMTSALPACLLVVLVCVAVYWSQGPLVVGRIVLYIFSLTTMKLSVKFVYSTYAFNYAKFITAGHLFMSSAMGFAIVLLRYQIYKQEIPIPTWNEFVFRIGPTAAATSFSLAMYNSGLIYCSASYAEIVGATTPIVTVLVVLLMGMSFNKWLLLPTLICILGCGLSVGGAVDISILGTVLVFASNVGRAVKGVFQQDLMTGEARARFDPCSLLAWTCFASAIIMLGWSVFAEGSAPVKALANSDAVLPTIGALLLSCANACALNLLILYVTKDLGAVGHLITGQVASVLTLGGSVLMFGDHLAPIQVVGFFFVLAGAFIYSRWSKAEAAAPKEPLKAQA